MNTERKRSGYYFALPRFATQWSGNIARDESNWLEINVAGLLMHLVVYCFAFHICLSGHSLWQQLILLLPLAFLVWIFWSLLFYFNSLCLKFLRAAGIMRQLPDGRAQSILIGIVVTCFALSLARTGGHFQVIGIAWLILVMLNLTAAGLLALRTSHVSAAAK